MQNIINQNVIRREIRRIVKEEIQKEIPKNQTDSLWKYLNKLNERIKCLEKQ